MPRRNLTGELTRYLDKRARLSTVPTETGVIRSTGSTGGGTWVTPAMVPVASTANPQNVGSSAAPGSSSGYAHGDHVHQGIHSLAVSGSTNLFGDVTLSASGGATLAQSTANVITLTAPAASTAIPAAVSNTGVVGTSTAWAPGDHVHALNIGTGLVFSSSTLAVQLANNAYLPGLTSTGATRNLIGISTADAALIGSTGLPSRLQGTSLDEVPGIATNLLPDSTTPARNVGSTDKRFNAVNAASLNLSSGATIGDTLTVSGTDTHTIAGGIVIGGTSLSSGYVAQANGNTLVAGSLVTKSAVNPKYACNLDSSAGGTRIWEPQRQGAGRAVISLLSNDDLSFGVGTGAAGAETFTEVFRFQNADAGMKFANTKIGFYAATPSTKLTVTGSRGGNAALASLLTALATIGLITDNTTT